MFFKSSDRLFGTQHAAYTIGPNTGPGNKLQTVFVHFYITSSCLIDSKDEAFLVAFHFCFLCDESDDLFPCQFPWTQDSVNVPIGGHWLYY